MLISCRINRVFILGCIGLLFIFFFPVTINADSIAAISTTSYPTIKKSIYPESMKNKSTLYNKLWGKHYRILYTTPITVQSTTLESLLGGVTVIDQVEDLHGLYLEDKDKRLYLLKPLGGSTSFIESDFFQTMYNKDDFRNTYTDKFIQDAYTIINPYTYIASDYMAKSVDLSSNNSRIFYLVPNSTLDTIADGSRIQDKLISVSDVPDINTQTSILNTYQMLELLQTDKSCFVNQDEYIRERMFDILIGDWNKIPENWNWYAEKRNDSIEIHPIVIDRNHAFTKVDGALFKQLLNILTLGFIHNYDAKVKNIKKFNKLGYALDIAVTPESKESDWVTQAQFLQRNITDELINDAFSRLPDGIEGDITENIKVILKERRDKLDVLAREYYKNQQETPVIIGTLHADEFLIDRTQPDSIRINIYNPTNRALSFSKTFGSKKAKEVWIYGLDGDNTFIVKGKAGKESPIYLIGGKKNNHYQLESGKKIKIFSYPEGKESMDSIAGAKVVYSDDDAVMAYDYEKTKYNQKSINPWGYYDSDRGINLGTFFTFTEYGFKRMPFSYQHRIGYSYLQGFLYKGIFPSYNRKRTFHLDASFGFPWNYYNFFGFGNNTNGYKDEKKKYNRVNVRELHINPYYEFQIDKYNKFTVLADYQLYKVINPDEDKFINVFYDDDSHIYKYNSFINVGAGYQYKRPLSTVFSNFEFSVSSGWIVGLRDIKRNFPYSEARAALEVSFSKKFSWATMMKGKVLYNDKFEFYQAATTELRGYRNNRFIGKQSFYQYSDLRLDMGDLKNGFIPLKYGLFAGVDYGRVWYPGEDSNKWHSSYGGGVWMIILNKIITKYSLFGSKDTVRFMFELGMGF